MPSNERRRIRDRIYQRRRRLQRQVLARKISPAQMTAALNAYALRLGIAIMETTEPTPTELPTTA